MLVAGLLVAMRVAACDEIATHTTRVFVAAGTSTGPNPAPYGYSVELCSNGATSPTYYTGPDHCLVSDSYKCCGLRDGASLCMDVSRDLCATSLQTKWCGDTPAPPATDEGLNEAETGVIVVVGVIAVAAVAGALAVCRANT